MTTEEKDQLKKALLRIIDIVDSRLNRSTEESIDMEFDYLREDIELLFSERNDV
jgi:hypothetical protein